jgi:hypothetical protein
LLTPEQAAHYRDDWQAYLQGFLDQHEARHAPRPRALQRLLSYLRG